MQELCTLLHPILLPEIRSALLHLIVFFFYFCTEEESSSIDK